MKKSQNFAVFFLLSLLLWLFWMAFTGNLSFLNIVLGATCSAIVSLFTIKLFGSAAYDGLTPIFLIRFPLFASGVVWEIIKANIDVAGIIINPGLPIDPRVFQFRTRLQGDFPKTIFAAFINLTPGTVVVDIQDDVFTVHALAERHETGLLGGQMEQAVARLFGQELTQAETGEARLS